MIELRLDGTGAGEGKASLSSGIVVDAGTSALALEAYDAAPVLFTIRR